MKTQANIQHPDIVTGRILSVIMTAANRPSGYVADVKAHSSRWDEKAGVYEISRKSFDKLREKYAAAKMPTRMSPSIQPDAAQDVCPFAVRTCCGKPDICSIDGGDCPDRLNSSCEKRR